MTLVVIVLEKKKLGLMWDCNRLCQNKRATLHLFVVFFHVSSKHSSILCPLSDETKYIISSNALVASVWYS